MKRATAPAFASTLMNYRRLQDIDVESSRQCDNIFFCPVLILHQEEMVLV